MPIHSLAMPCILQHIWTIKSSEQILSLSHPVKVYGYPYTYTIYGYQQELKLGFSSYGPEALNIKTEVVLSFALRPPR